MSSLASKMAIAPRWILLADDDTFVHVEALLDFLASHDPHVPAMFGYMLSDAHVSYWWLVGNKGI